MNTKTLTIKEAQEKKIYIFTDEYKIETTNLYNFVMESVDETTTQNGVAARQFVEKVEDEDGEEQLWTISTWGARGNNYKKGYERFKTEEEAADTLFRYIYEEDFLMDCNRDTSYYENMEEAEKALKEIFGNNIEE